MIKQSTSFLTVLACFLVLLSCACDPCDDDPGTIEIDRADRSAPEMYWQIVRQSMTPSGPISSLSLIHSLDETINVGGGEYVEITLMAADPQSGISTMDIIGGFGYTCSNPNQAIIFDGVIPVNPVSYDLNEGVCAFEEAAYPVFIIDGPNLCPGNFPDVVSGGYEINGFASNANGLEAQNRLVVNVIGAGDI